jgi:hypothetical protein
MNESEFRAEQEAEQRKFMRAIIAGMMMTKLSLEGHTYFTEAASDAVKAADALLAELERTEKEAHDI